MKLCALGAMQFPAVSRVEDEGFRVRKFRQLRLFAAMATVAVGVLGIAPAASATDVGGYTILHAGTNDMAHTCNVISSSANTQFQAVVCADLTTGESGTDYYVQAQVEAYCQTKGGAPATCNQITAYTDLSVGGGGYTGPFGATCILSGNSCPTNGRLIVATRKWDYSISAAQNGVCSSNPNSAYNVWGLALGYGNSFNGQEFTQILAPDNLYWTVGQGQNGPAPNDGVNESTGHFYVCP